MRGRQEAVDGKPLDGCLEREEAKIRRIDVDVGAAVAVGAWQVGGRRPTGPLASGSHAVRQAGKPRGSTWGSRADEANPCRALSNINRLQLYSSLRDLYADDSQTQETAQ